MIIFHCGLMSFLNENDRFSFMTSKFIIYVWHTNVLIIGISHSFYRFEHPISMVVVYFENATLNCFGIYVYVVAVVAAVCDMRAFYIPEFFPSAICGHFTDRNNSQHIVYDYESLNVQTFSMRYQSLGRK